MFFVVNDGDDIWMNVLYAGLFEIPVVFLVGVLVEYGPRKILYWIIYLTSGISAAGLYFTTEGELPTQESKRVRTYSLASKEAIIRTP